MKQLAEKMFIELTVNEGRNCVSEHSKVNS